MTPKESKLKSNPEEWMNDIIGEFMEDPEGFVKREFADGLHDSDEPVAPLSLPNRVRTVLARGVEKASWALQQLSWWIDPDD